MASLKTGQREVQASTDRALPWRVIVFFTVLVLYAALTASVLLRTQVIALDVWAKHFHLRAQAYLPGWYQRVELYELLGQRAPATLAALPWFLWRAWRARSPRPLVLLVTALLTLNVSVGVIKELTGRIGPKYNWNAHDVFAGGDIFPSGHVSNAVVLYGVLAMLAVNYRKIAAAIAVFLSVTLGLGTVFINTHWVSDVVGGWLAGGLVLIALPWLMPYSERATDAVLARIAQARLRRRVRVTTAARPARPVRPARVPVEHKPAFPDPVRPPAGVPARTRVPAELRTRS